VVVIVWQLYLQLHVQSVPITTKAMSSKSVHGEVYSMQHYVITFVSDLRRVGGYLRVLRFPPRYNWNIVESGAKHHKPNRQVQFSPRSTPTFLFTVECQRKNAKKDIKDDSLRKDPPSISIKLYVCCFCSLLYRGDTLIYSEIQHGFRSADLLFIFDRPIICKTVEYIDQLDKSSRCVSGFKSWRIGRRHTSYRWIWFYFDCV
jgi:hypothetical protein